MTAEFYSEYLKPGVTSRQKQLLYIMNPNKFRLAVIFGHGIECVDQV